MNDPLLPPLVSAILESAAHLSESQIDRLLGPEPDAEQYLLDRRANDAHTDAFVAARQLAPPNQLAVVDEFLSAALFANPPTLFPGITDEEVARQVRRTLAILTAGDAAVAVLAREYLTDANFKILYGRWGLVE